MEKTTAASFLNDNDKIEQLSKYLILSLEAHKQGKPKQLNELFEHLQTEQADLQLMKLWISIFIKTMNNYSNDPKIDCSLLINFILFRSRWLSSNSNYMAIYDQYEKFCFATMALYKTYIPIIFKLLLEHLIPKEFHEEGKREQHLQILIGNTSFTTFSDLKSYVNVIMKNPKYELTESKLFVELEQDHSKFMAELFGFHPKAEQKMKNVKKILIGLNQSRKKASKCFFLEKETGEKEDISYLKACSMAAEIFAAKKGQNILKEKQIELVNKIIGSIEKILKIYPLTLSSFSTYLNEVFPHRRQEILLQRIFFMNVLKLSLKLEKVRLSILNICFERLIQIDAEIKIDAINNELSVEMSKKLDWILLIFFDYIDYIFEIRQRSEHNGFGVIPLTRSSAPTVQEYSDKMLDKFYDLLELFQRHLLVTYRPRYVQFIFFYLCSYTEIYPDFMQTFLSRLIINIKNEEETRLIRINSANYLRSIAIRAKFIPDSIIKKTLELLLDYIKSYSKQAKKKILACPELKTSYSEQINLVASSNFSDRAAGSNNEKENFMRDLFLKFDIYYHTITAIAYILLERKGENKDVNKENFEKFSKTVLRYNEYLHILEFIPLKLVSRLLAIYEHYENEEMTALLNAELLNDSIESRSFRGSQLIEDYLPFDPNFLFHSRKVIEPNYNFLKDENLEEMKIDFQEESNRLSVGKNVIIDDTINETESENYSSISKHDTESSNGAVELKLNKVNVKRKLDDKEDFEETQKKLVKDNGEYRNITVV